MEEKQESQTIILPFLINVFVNKKLQVSNVISTSLYFFKTHNLAADLSKKKKIVSIFQKVLHIKNIFLKFLQLFTIEHVYINPF